MNIYLQNKKKIATTVLIALFTLFLIKLSSKATIKKVENRDLNFIEKIIVKIDENIIVNPYHVIQKMNSLKDIGRVPQQKIPNGVNTCIGKDSIPIEKKYLYSYYSEQDNTFVAELLQLNTNEVLHQWHIPLQKAQKIYYNWNKGLSKSNFDNNVMFNLSKLKRCRLRVPVLIENKAIVVKLQGMLLCLNKKSKIKWKHEKFFHHSIKLDGENNIWAASYHDTSKHSPYLADQIVKLNPETGEILYKKNVGEIFRNNPKYDLSRIKLRTEDPYHLNDIQPVKDNSRFWKQGDLFLSLKGLNTVMLYRPSTGKIIWQKSTGWSNQHDVRILNDSMISIFDNNLKRKLPNVRVDGTNRFVIYNFTKDTVISFFNNSFKKNNIKTPTQGKAKFFEEDSILYVEATDQSFCVMKDFKSDKSYKCFIPGRTKEQATNMGWFRLIN